MTKRLGSWALLLLLAITLSGCFLASNREINLLVVRTDTGGSEATVTYRMPPPKEGKTYMLWLIDAEHNKRVRVGVLEPTERLRAIKTRVDFWVTGAVVSIENSPNSEQMSGDSVLVSGWVDDNTKPALRVPTK